MIFELFGSSFLVVESLNHYTAAFVGSMLLLFGILDRYLPGTKSISPPERWWWVAVFGLLMIIFGAPMLWLLGILFWLSIILELLRSIISVFR